MNTITQIKTDLNDIAVYLEYRKKLMEVIPEIFVSVYSSRPGWFPIFFWEKHHSKGGLAEEKLVYHDYVSLKLVHLILKSHLLHNPNIEEK